ncbi:MAG: ASPIC/UnbV domain-containing protein [Xenococcus sp. (in: cyanobacteria)]
MAYHDGSSLCSCLSLGKPPWSAKHQCREKSLLESNDTSVFGLQTPDPTTKGLYIGYDLASQTWQVRLVSPHRERIRFVIESTELISNTETIGFTNLNPDFNSLSDRLWLYDTATEQFLDSSITSGITALTSAQSVVAGDFDNDMDVDLYLAIGQRLAVADFDNNGFLDIFAGSLTSRSRDRTYLGEAPQLFQNQGNDNNWIQFKLEGTTSNRDAVGARVILTTPDGTSQLREQNGGNHTFGQNSSRLHSR